MVQLVIIGAGPIGLYWARLLAEAGVNVLVLDPRAGHYTRPGGILIEPLKAFVDDFNHSQSILPLQEIEHILYSKLKKLNVHIEQKKFVKFSNLPTGRGIFVEDDKGCLEYIACDYVFDCTGSKRVLINAVNETVSPLPFAPRKIYHETPVTKHLLAYVRMDNSDFLKIADSHNETRDFLPTKRPPEKYIAGMEMLRYHGWSHMGYPKCYGYSLSNGATCFCLECPEDLLESQYEDWAQTVFNVLSGERINFEPLLPAQNYDKKWYLVAFNVAPQAIDLAVYESADLPTLFPLGDAQIQPHISVGHGLESGMKRAQILFAHLTISGGVVTGFDVQGYTHKIATAIREHEQVIIDYYDLRNKYFSDWLIASQKYYDGFLQQLTPERREYLLVLKSKEEIDVRIKYKTSVFLFQMFKHDISSDSQEQLKRISAEFIDILGDLPPKFVVERETVRQHLRDVSQLLTQETKDHLLRDKRPQLTRIGFFSRVSYPIHDVASRELDRSYGPSRRE